MDQKNMRVKYQMGMNASQGATTGRKTENMQMALLLMLCQLENAIVNMGRQGRTIAVCG